MLAASLNGIYFLHSLMKFSINLELSISGVFPLIKTYQITDPHRNQDSIDNSSKDWVGVKIGLG
jgi:hypothetical protein